MSRIQFNDKLILRDMNKGKTKNKKQKTKNKKLPLFFDPSPPARIAFSSSTSIATGNWGCGAFGNDHILKFCQQWMAASEVYICVRDETNFFCFEPRFIYLLPRLGVRKCTITLMEISEQRSYHKLVAALLLLLLLLLFFIFFFPHSWLKNWRLAQ